jgi:predicted dehydrogenase
MRKNELKILQVGLGSMGRRRIRCLLYNHIGQKQIAGFDIDSERCRQIERDHHVRTFNDFQHAVRDFQPNAFIISTPPDTHHKYFLFAARHQRHVFVEPGTTAQGYRELRNLLNSRFVAAPSCSWVYLPAIQSIKRLLTKNTIGKVLSFQYHMGQYLPDWHPWEDYRSVYFAQKKTGACREMFVFELIWLTNLFSAPLQQVRGLHGKISDLEMSADDIYAAVVQLQNGIIGTVNIDVITRAPFRTLRIIGQHGVLHWEWLADNLQLFHIKDKKWKKIQLQRGGREKHYIVTEDMYQQETKAFVDAIIKDAPFPHTFSANYHILKMLLSLEKNSRP